MRVALLEIAPSLDNWISQKEKRPPASRSLYPAHPRSMRGEGREEGKFARANSMDILRIGRHCTRARAG